MANRVIVLCKKTPMHRDPESPEALADDPSFRAFVAGTDPEAVRRWAAWMDANPDRQADVQAAAELVRSLRDYQPRTLPPEQIETELRRLQHRLGADAQTPVRLLTTPRHWWWAAAASVLLGGCLIGLLRSEPTLPAPAVVAGEKTASDVPVAVSPQSAPALTHRTGYGERRRVTLPDGSRVWLNANSAIHLTDWRDDHREVRLDGEAFFEITKKRLNQRAVKFTVLARQVAVDVLGTQFDVSTRNRRVKVVLNEGRIRLRVADRQQPRALDLLPGDLVEVSDRQEITFQTRIDPTPHRAWTADELVFDDAPLAEVARLIHDNYGHEVVFADPALAQRRLTATLPDANLDVLLLALEKAFSLSVKRENNTIRLAPVR